MIRLQNLCINLIAEEFERFHSAFTASDSVKLKRDFYFLQFRYSAELGSELFKRRKLKDQYLDFIINKHLKFLDEEWIYDIPSYKYSMDYIFRRLPNLTRISCISACDDILKNIAKFCPKIVEIRAIDSSVTDIGIKYLCENENGSVPCPELKLLSLRSSYVTDDGLGHLLRNVRSLEETHHERIPFALYTLHKDVLPNLENAPTYNLTALSVFAPDRQINDDLLKICLTVCPKLKSLTGVVIRDKELLSYFNHTRLETLSISFQELRGKIDIDNVLKNCGRSLRALTVDNCKLSISQLAINHPKLKHFTTTSVSFTDELADSKAVFHSLVFCRFHEFEMNSENMKGMHVLLSSSPNLKHVIFESCDVSPGAKISIVKSCEKLHLKTIFFMDTIVELSFAKDILMRCPSLTVLKLFFCHLPKQLEDELMRFGKTLSNKPHVHIIS